MATLTEHAMLNGLEENLKSSIEYAGGEVPSDTCVWEYPDIIREQLSSNKFDNTTEGITIDAIDAPEYSGISTWPEGTILQDLLEDLFYKVLPKVPSVIKGDIITTDESGKDQFAPDPESYIDSLIPNTQYLRLFLASQKDPIYISLAPINGVDGNINLTNYYTKSEIDNKLDNYYNKSDVNSVISDINEKFKDYYTKSEVDEVKESLQTQLDNLDEQVNNIDQKVIQIVQSESATENDAINTFDSIFIK